MLYIFYKIYAIYILQNICYIDFTYLVGKIRLKHIFIYCKMDEKNNDNNSSDDKNDLGSENFNDLNTNNQNDNTYNNNQNSNNQNSQNNNNFIRSENPDINTIIENLEQQLQSQIREQFQSSFSGFQDIDNENIVHVIQSVLESIQTSNIGITSETADHIQFQLELEWMIPGVGGININDDEPKFENCKEINEKVCKFEKIKDGDELLNNNECCNICMETFVAGQFKRCLPNCKHLFHKKCIDKWLKKNASCPICRNTLKEASSNDDEDEVVLFQGFIER